MAEGPRGMPGIAHYRKKPHTVKAIQFDSLYWKQIKEFCPTLDHRYKHIEIRDNFFIPTLEGTMTVNDGDYIIQGVEGEFYPCKASIFRKTYERVEE